MSSSANATVSARVTLDGSGVSAGVQQAKADISQLGPAAQRSVGQATEAVKTHGAAWQEAGNKINETLAEIAAAAGVAFSIDKLKEWVESAIEGAEKIDTLSQSLGVSAQNLQVFQYAAGLAGTSIDVVTGAMERLERAQVEAKDGNAQTAEAFRAIGVTATDTNGKLKPTDQLIIEVAQHLSQLANGSTKVAIATQLMGRGAADNIPYFNKLGAEFQELKERAEALGIVLSAKDQAALVAAKEQMNELGQEVKGLGNQFAIILLPAITSVVAGLQQFATSGGAKSALASLASGVQFVVSNFDALLQVVKALVEIKLASWAVDAVGALKELAVSASGAQTSILSLKGGFAVLFSAIAGYNIGTYLFNQFLIVKQAGADMVGALLTGWSAIRNGAALAWAYITAGATAALNVVKGLFASVVSGVGTFAGFNAKLLELTGQFQASADLSAVAQSMKDYATGVQKGVDNTSNLKDEVEKINSSWKKETAEIASNVAAQKQAYAADAQRQEAVDKATAGLAELTTVTGAYLDSLSKGKPALDAEKTAIEGVEAAGQKLIKGGADQATVNREVADQVKQIITAYTNATKAQGNYNSQLDATTAKQAELKQTQGDADKALNDLTAKLEGPYAKAQADYLNSLIEADQIYAKLKKDNDSEADAQTRSNAIKTKALQVRDQEIKQLKEQHDLFAQNNQDLANELALQGVAPQYQDAITQGLKKYDELLKSHYDFYGNYEADETKLKAALQQQLPIYTQQRQAINDLAAARKNDETINQAWVGIVSQGFDSLGQTLATFATGGFKTMHDFWESLVGDAKQFIAAIISQMLKLTVFNGIINSLFGLTGSSALPTGLGSGILGQLFGGGLSAVTGGASSGGGVLGLFGGSGAGASVGGVGGGGVTSLFDPTTWVSAGQKIYQGFSTGFSNIGNTIGNTSARLFGTSTYSYGSDFVGPGSDLAPDFYGPPSELAGGGLSYGGYGSGLGQGLGIAGGVVAGYNEYNAAGGGVAGLAGGAAYGVGTYLGGAAITATLSGGLSAGVAALGALGPIGWIALAAMAVNLISGGKLFGTAATKFVSAQQDLTIGAGGADVSNSETLKGQHALFGGSYTKTKNLATDPAAQAAADAFYKALVDQRTSFAANFNAAVGTLVGGSFVTTFDKKGKQTGTTTTINGQTYKDETQDQFSERLQAANIADVLDKLGVSADSFLSGFEKNADDLIKKAQELAGAAVAAQKDITNGIGLLGKDSTLAKVVNLTISLNDGTEALSDTYTRLVQEYAVLKTNIDYASISIGKTSEDMVKFADAAAQAAGGVQQLAQLTAQFNQDFYSAGEITANGIATLRAKVAGEGAAIGESADVSLDQFKKDYLAALPTLTPQQLVAWQTFGTDLYNLTSTEATQGYKAFISSFDSSATIVSGFEQAMNSLNTTLTDNIKTANALAIAEGKTGADAADIGKIIAATITQGAALYQKLQTDTAGLVAQLFGSTIDQLQARVDQYWKLGIVDTQDIAKINDMKQAQQGAQTLGLATQIIDNFGQLGAVSGDSLQQLAQQYGVPLDQLAKYLNTDSAGLQNIYTQQVDMAKAALETSNNTMYTNELLQDILAQAQGKALPFSTDQLLKAQNGQDYNPNKPGANTAVLPSRGGTAIPVNTSRYTPGTGTTVTPGTGTGVPTPAPTVPTQADTQNLTKSVGSLGTQVDDLNTNVTNLTATIARFGLSRPVSNR